MSAKLVMVNYVTQFYCIPERFYSVQISLFFRKTFILYLGSSERDGDELDAVVTDINYCIRLEIPENIQR